MTGETILIIDDNQRNRELLTDLLEDEGYVVAQAATAREGIAYAQALAPALILMDIGLQDMDGYEATTLLKGDTGTRHIPILAVTAYAMREDRERAFAAGCNGFISKPIDLEEFLLTVAETIAGATARGA